MTTEFKPGSFYIFPAENLQYKISSCLIRSDDDAVSFDDWRREDGGELRFSTPEAAAEEVKRRLEDRAARAAAKVDAHLSQAPIEVQL